MPPGAVPSPGEALRETGEVFPNGATSLDLSWLPTNQRPSPPPKQSKAPRGVEESENEVLPRKPTLGAVTVGPIMTQCFLRVGEPQQLWPVRYSQEETT